MIKAVLLDLDNTLLHNPDRQWVSAFRQRFEEHIVDCFGMTRGAEALRSGINAIYAERESFSTNAALLRTGLADGLSQPVAAITHALASFYAGRYEQLASLTAPISKADALMNCLLGQGLLVAIATNPLFPELATRRRLIWAGLGAYIDELAFITHSENMHAAKPDPAYYAETLARVGVEPDEALMVGDSAVNDMRPAASLGIHTWQVDRERGLDPIHEHVHQANWRQAYPPRQLTPDMILPQFRGNVRALHGLLTEVKDQQWLQRPDPDEWSILQILCHLWQAETAVHQSRLRTMLDEDDPFIVALPAPGPHIAPCHDDGHEIFRRFWQERLRTIDLLAKLSKLDWQRPARHSIFGLTNLLEMAHFTAQHDRLHIAQLCQTLGKCSE